VPVVPVAITGTENVMPAWKRLSRPRVTVTIGQPIFFPRGGRAKGPQLDEYTDVIMCRLAALLPPQYRGVYASRVAADPQARANEIPAQAE
jgi:1-acyl-sn-glycerol-3-phosphate acyltransferase